MEDNETKNIVKEYIDKREAYLLLKHKAETYMLPATKEAYEKAARLIDSIKTCDVQPVNDWISIKDKLPEPRTWVLAYIKYPSPVFEIERGIHKTGDVKKVFYDGFYDGFCKDKSFCGSGTITHWQPLPKPPKGE